jgi:hypothetical protein
MGFLNLENLTDVRLTDYHPFVRPSRGSLGQWTAEYEFPFEILLWGGIMKRVWLATAVLLSAACGSTPEPQSTPTPQPVVTPAPPRPAAFNAIGSFDFVTMVQGEQVNGVIEIVRLDTGALGGKMTTSATPDLQLRTVTVEGRKITIESDVPDAGALVVVLNFEADNNTFTGNWSLSAVGDSGNLSGKRRTT